MIKHCLNCGKELIKKPSWTYNAFNKQKYCSAKCRQEDSRCEKIHKECNYCGEEMFIKPSDENFGMGKYCSRDCFNKWYSENNRGETHHNWNGGMYRDSDGYLRIKRDDHPKASYDGYVMEHILVVEEQMGRFLESNETVHHIDGNKQNNSPDNLYLFKTGGEHTAYHHSLKRGEANLLISNLEGYNDN
jgi:hypothetical protein